MAVLLLHSTKSLSQTLSLSFEVAALRSDSIPNLTGNIFVFDASDSSSIVKLTKKVIYPTTTFQIPHAIKKLRIKVYVFSFEPFDSAFSIKNREDSIHIRIALKPKELAPASVTAKMPAYLIAGDTIKFKAEKYLAGNEQTAEELLKRIPGVKVNSTSGEISYRGVPIETLMIDGVNLLEKNYTILSKTLAASKIDSIAVLQNYQPNALLRDLSKDDKVAISLKLKPDASSISQQVNIGSGFAGDDFTPIDAQHSLLAVTGQNKAILNTSYNNTGQVKAPSSPFQQAPSPHQTALQPFLIQGPISPINIPHIGRQNRILQNNEISHQTVFSPKATRQFQAKFHVSLLGDRARYTNLYNDQITFENTSFSTTDKYTVQRNPNHLLFDSYFDIGVSPKSNLSIKVYTGRTTENYKTTQVLNNTSEYTISRKDQLQYIVANATLTKRIDSTALYQIIVDNGLSSIRQANNLNSRLSTIPTLSLINNQAIDGAARQTKLNIKYLKKHSAGLTSNLLLGINNNYASLFSKKDTSSDNINYASKDTNDLSLNNVKLFIQPHLTWSKTKAIKIDLGLRGSVFTSQLRAARDEQNQTETQLVIEPFFMAKYTPSTKWNYTIQAIRQVQAQPLNNQYIQAIDIDARLSTANTPNIIPATITQATFQTQYINLYRHLDAYILIGYTDRKNNFFQQIDITDSKTISRNILLPAATSSANFSIGAAKYLPAIGTRLSVNHSFTSINSFNLINSSTLRSIRSNQSSINFAATNNKLKRFIFSFECDLLRTSATVDKENRQLNTALLWFASILYSIPDGGRIQLAAEQTRPDIRNSNTYTFFDISASWPLKKDRIQLECSIKNVLNERQAINVTISDYLVRRQATSLAPMIAVLSLRMLL